MLLIKITNLFVVITIQRGMTYILIYFPIFYIFFFKRNQKRYNLFIASKKVRKIQRWNVMRLCELYPHTMAHYRASKSQSHVHLNTSRLRRNHAGVSTSLYTVAHTFFPSYHRSKTHATYNFPAFVVAQRRVVPYEIPFFSRDSRCSDGIYIKEAKRPL